MKEKKLAIFDIDGTIFRSSMLIELIKEFIAEGIFKSTVGEGYENSKEAWENREGSYETYISDVVKVFLRHISSVSYKEFRRVAYKVVAREKSRVYRFTKELTAKLKTRGYYLLAISHSPKLIVEGFCKTLGFSKVYGLMYAVDEGGRFTGSVLHSDIIFDKANIVKRALEKGGLTLKGSVGVGDTESDISFLKLVEKPICFNPNQKLFRAAKKYGWQVVVERKDVIYKI